jgi:large subunit ribosomal protein L32
MEYSTVLHVLTIVFKHRNNIDRVLNMAVPKKKTSKSKRNMRRSHHAIKLVNVVVDSKTGEYRLPHHMCLSDSTYNDRTVVVAKKQANDSDSITS